MQKKLTAVEQQLQTLNERDQEVNTVFYLYSYFNWYCSYCIYFFPVLAERKETGDGRRSCGQHEAADAGALSH